MQKCEIAEFFRFKNKSLNLGWGGVLVPSNKPKTHWHLGQNT